MGNREPKNKISPISTKNEKLKEKALKDGVHELINFPRTIETDSGSFQLSVYGDIDINNEEVIEFQEAIGTDIGTSLDIPTAPYVKREEAEEDLQITIERAKEAAEKMKLTAEDLYELNIKILRILEDRNK